MGKAALVFVENFILDTAKPIIKAATTTTPIIINLLTFLSLKILLARLSLSLSLHVISNFKCIVLLFILIIYISSKILKVKEKDITRYGNELHKFF
jgi:hypothetical protein